MTAKTSAYLSMPMRGYVFYNFQAFENAKAVIRRHYPQVDIISPHNLDIICGDVTAKWERDRDGHRTFTSVELNESFDFTNVLRRDMLQVISCEHLILGPNWSESEGCQIEYQVAKWAGRPISFYMNGWLNGPLADERAFPDAAL